ncbi:MAG: hypothetical protein QOE61_3779, partial [Micromonosporaceae bacterium]|nr:hypothetical protein [Micromonosporaceae bacterium]
MTATTRLPQPHDRPVIYSTATIITLDGSDTIVRAVRSCRPRGALRVPGRFVLGGAPCRGAPRLVRVVVELAWFDPASWEDWLVERRPVIPDGMPFLVDDDLRFEDAPGVRRPTTAVNQWLRELPSSGSPAPLTWAAYARALRDWMAFLRSCGVGLFDGRAALRGGLSSYAVHRSAGPLQVRFEASTWNQHVSVLASFYRWAIAEQFTDAEPFTYRQAVTMYADQVQHRQVNLATRRTPKPHVSIKYLERDFADMFIRGLGGRDPQGFDDPGFRGRELTRNAAMGKLALETGLRLREFSYLLVYEIPPLPPAPTDLPIAFPVATALTKGRKFRTTWIS